MILLLTALLLYIVHAKELPSSINRSRSCIANTRFVHQNKICACGPTGKWSDQSCKKLAISRRATCEPGRTFRQDCNQCICQSNGQPLCTNVHCQATSPTAKPFRSKLASIGLWCTPFRSYYVECSVCVCPASGHTREALCSGDNSCAMYKPVLNNTNLKTHLTKTVCLPNVMYVFTCLHCLCSDKGYFEMDKCVETCEGPKTAHLEQRCRPHSFYRKQCNVCYCPADGYPTDEHCTKTACSGEYRLSNLPQLLRKSYICVPYTFTAPRCVYCGCGTQGASDENACVELECLKSYNYENARDTICSPGEMVPMCVQCFCLSNSTTSPSYCSQSCSSHSKMEILQKVLTDSLRQKRLLDASLLRQQTAQSSCAASTIYEDNGRYCICPQNGIVDNNLCTAVSPHNGSVHASTPDNTGKEEVKNKQTCTASTFVEFDCNTCFCSKTGTIDPKWCTYDDCEAKKITQESHKLAISPARVVEPKGTCTTGSITKVDCNFCICPASGLTADLACTSNPCSGLDQTTTQDKFICEPFTYYVVDCNTCYCPRDGIKNLAKCTKNLCENNLLRSSECLPGQLFSNECNVCVCPPNGDKADKACTNNTCADADAAWKKILVLSQAILDNHIHEDITRSLEVCFRGEEFTVGCNLCVCTEVGLRAYATCTPILCSDNDEIKKQSGGNNKLPASLSMMPNERSMQSDSGVCGNGCVVHIAVKSPGASERAACVPGDIYISRCQQCICPSTSTIAHNYCRPLIGKDCEQTTANIPHLRSGGNENEHDDLTRIKFMDDAAEERLANRGNKTQTRRHACPASGPVTDECFICHCENNLLDEDLCFKSDAPKCKERKSISVPHQNW